MGRKVHKNTGVVNGKLNECPNMPNCVVSFYPDDRKHYKRPWQCERPLIEVRAALVEILEGNSRVEIQSHTPEYIHCTFTVPIFGFVDDVEFLFDDVSKTVHYRSASRIGYSDLGANKRRMKSIFKELHKKVPSLAYALG